MKKGERTRERIIAESAAVFNQRGFFGTTIDDLLHATGLQKGGLYRHFQSKEELALEAFDYAIGLYEERSRRAITGISESKKQIHAFLDEMLVFVDHPPLPGGCPLLNTGTESDDAIPELHERTQQAITRWRFALEEIIQQGIRAGEFQPDADPTFLATIIISTLEGSIFLSKIYGDYHYLAQGVVHLKQVIRHQ